MSLVEVYVGFYKPGWRNAEGRVDPRCWLGHCEMWGYTSDQTWVFLDPSGRGVKVVVTHHHDEVIDTQQARFELCDTILRIPYTGTFSVPPLNILTCASFIGAFLGIRALVPGTLRRKLLAKGAEVIHENPQGRSG
jgi:hypothetical protein